jgi:hypothetical protein
VDMGAAVGTIRNMEVTMYLEAANIGEVTALLVAPDDTIYGLFGRPGAEEAPGGAADVTGYLASSEDDSYLKIHAIDATLDSAETMGDGLGDADPICETSHECHYEADTGTSGFPALSEILGSPVAGTYRLCIGDSVANTGARLKTGFIRFAREP